MTPEKRILQFIDHLKASGMIAFKEDFYRTTGIRRQYCREVSIGNNRFTSTHINSICKHYPVNANWIFGIEDKMFRGINKRHRTKSNELKIKTTD
ncbi:hypothetical protein [Winogradskyella forsetii]|uniref:hypothetical protein n=1 Tax=Winogradskyella forsetii TaxID=2686077 RepID=UPI0015C15992|nr:hypothetical protein [Winogradskyella forsetii]